MSWTEYLLSSFDDWDPNSLCLGTSSRLIEHWLKKVYQVAAMEYGDRDAAMLALERSFLSLLEPKRPTLFRWFDDSRKLIDAIEKEVTKENAPLSMGGIGLHVELRETQRRSLLQRIKAHQDQKRIFKRLPIPQILEVYPVSVTWPTFSQTHINESHRVNCNAIHNLSSPWTSYSEFHGFVMPDMIWATRSLLGSEGGDSHIFRDWATVVANVMTAVLIERPGGYSLYLTDRPMLRTDSNFRLHGAGEPSVAWRSGELMFHHHGTMIPKTWAATPPNKWNPRWILTERNAELRRLLVSELGWDQILKTLPAERVHRDRDMELYRVTLRAERAFDYDEAGGYRPLPPSPWDNFPLGDNKCCLLRVTCPSTGSGYTLCVPPTMRTCTEARNWTFGDEPVVFSVET